MCLQDYKMGRHKYSMFPSAVALSDGQRHPGTQSAITAAVAPFSLPRIFVPNNPLRTAIRLVLAAPGAINGETGAFDPIPLSVFGFIYDGPPDPAAIVQPPIYALLSVSNLANMTDMVRIEDIGLIVTQAMCFQPMWDTDAELPFGGYTVWDIMADRVLMHTVQGPLEG